MTYLELFQKELSKYIFPLVLFTLGAYLFVPTFTIPLLSDDYLWVKDVARFESFTEFVANHFALKEMDFRYRPLMPTGVTSKQFAFIFRENQLVNVTPNYRSD